MRLAAGFVCLVSFVSLATAQGTDALLTGNVVDASGAHIPDAIVTALNINTGVATIEKSNASGVYLFPILPPGDYRIVAEKQGFKKYLLDRLTLRTGDHVEQNLALEIGGVTETVQVEANSEAINYLNSTQGGLLSSARITDLPVAGRNVMDLVLTQPGVIGTNFNGARNDMLNISLDHTNIQDNFITENLSTTQIFTSVDRIEEVRVVTSPADAEYGRGSGQVQLISKSGTNQFHGTGFDNLHNTDLNANTWSNNRNGLPRSTQVYNDAGGSLGGPLRKNKTFFFGLFEANIQHQRSTVTSTTLTPLARQGIFRFYPGVQNANANANNPTVDLNGNPVTPRGATGPLQSVNLFGLDPNRLAPDTTGLVAKNLGLLPLPNNYLASCTPTCDGLNTAAYVWSRLAPDDVYSWTIRGDHNFNERQRFSVSYSHDTERDPNGFDGQPYPTSPVGVYTDTGTVVSAQLTSTLRSNLVNEAYLGVSRNSVQFHAPWTADGATQQSVLPSLDGIPYILNLGSEVSSPLGTSSSEDPQGRLQGTYLAGEKISWLRGKHAIKAGVEFRSVVSNSFVSFNVVPRINLGIAASSGTQNINTISGIGANGTMAGNILATLAGSVANENQQYYSPGGANPQWISGENAQHTWHNREWGTFVQDDIKLTNNFTLHAGMRWDYYGVPWEGDGRIGTVVGGSQSIFGISGTTLANLFQPGVENLSNLTQLQLIGKNSPHPGIQPWQGKHKNFAPVVGMTWALPWLGANKTILRAGYSIAYERFTQVLFDQLYGYSAPGLGQAQTYAPPAYQNLTNAFLPLATTTAPLATVPINDNNSSTQTILVADNGLKQPYIQNWNISLGREIHRGIIVDVRYVGSKGSKMLRGTNINENNIFENGILSAFQVTEAGGNSPLLNQIFKGLNIPSVGVVDGVNITGSQAMRQNSTLYSYLIYNNVGNFANFLGYNTFVTGVRGGLLKNAGLPANFVVANPQFGFAYLVSNFSNSTFNSFQLEVNKQFGQGFQVQGSYVRSKALGDYDGTAQSEVSNFFTIRNQHLDKRLLSFDEPNVLRTSGIWMLPFGPKQRFLGTSHGAVAHMVEKWQTSVIFYKLSGTPTGFSNSFSSPQTFGTYNTVTPTPVNVGALPTGSVYKSGNNVLYFQGLTQVPDPSVKNMPSNLQSLSPLLAVQNASGQVVLQNPVAGQLGSLSPTNFRGLGTFTLNLTASKPVVLSRERNIVMTFRADAINLLNKPVWSTPNLNIDSTSFGQITSTVSNTNRQINLTLRVTF
jgi:Carboxypeptidase regulatory-like domain/TonB dependent receptor